ncbi:methyltransferase [Mobiluncus mulieris]|uniref:Methyltransferase n=1 Tax=Mobiluncus mulieris TaxID=2052 RepID=A0A848RF36_9ACTO|nr:methyltransferase [Mobiluncus mulieris]MCU9970936.1 methyltransferase [Mobiluncus mulieris]NMW90899.1 methyltransferase [Mobiluncus mulieris]NMW92470.1 methyltransferase [Mobiluncus mulieris]
MNRRPHKQHFAARRDGSAGNPGTKHNGTAQNRSTHNSSAHSSSTHARRKNSPPPTPKAHATPKPEGNEQYFAANPSAAARPRELEVELAGMTFRIHTDSGVFSGDGLDKGTAVLLRKVPKLPEGGVFVDVGCGWGPLSLVMARQRPAARVVAVDVNARALDLTAKNARENGLGNLEVLAEAAALAQLADGSVDVIWSNPPVRIGKDALHAMWTAWRVKLRPGGVAYLVMGRNLGADTFAAWARDSGWETERLASSKGFRVLQLRPMDA